MSGLLIEAQEAVTELFSEGILRFGLTAYHVKRLDDDVWYEVIFCDSRLFSVRTVWSRANKQSFKAAVREAVKEAIDSRSF